MNNEMKLEFDAVSENEGFARVAVAAFITPLDPTLEEVADIKTAVSEAVTNAIIHGYAGWSGDEPGKVEVRCCLRGDVLHIEIEDKGRGCGCGTGHGAAVYHQAGYGPFRYGFCLHGGLYGRFGCDKRARKRNSCKNGKEAGNSFLVGR